MSSTDLYYDQVTQFTDSSQANSVDKLNDELGLIQAATTAIKTDMTTLRTVDLNLGLGESETQGDYHDASLDPSSGNTKGQFGLPPFRLLDGAVAGNVDMINWGIRIPSGIEAVAGKLILQCDTTATAATWAKVYMLGESIAAGGAVDFSSHAANFTDNWREQMQGAYATETLFDMEFDIAGAKFVAGNLMHLMVYRDPADADDGSNSGIRVHTATLRMYLDIQHD